MTSPLQPHQFGQMYHGTASRMRTGQQIVPGKPSNYAGITADIDAQHVFATDDITAAWHHAQNASAIKNKGKVVYRNGFSPDETGEDPENLPRPLYRPSAPRVYPVKPTGPMQVDAEQARGGYVAADPNDTEFDGDRASAFQSKFPLDVTGHDVGHVAQAEAVAQYGADIPHWRHSNDLTINNAVGTKQTYPQWQNMNKDQFGGDW